MRPLLAALLCASPLAAWAQTGANFGLGGGTAVGGGGVGGSTIGGGEPGVGTSGPSNAAGR
jgi:hypothetical protein